VKDGPIVIQCRAEDLMPNGRPANSLMTPQETIEYLRLDQGQKDPEQSLRRYAREFGIRVVQIGNATRYPLEEVKRFIQRKFADDNDGATLTPAPARKRI
jgi:hypothetical protein